MDYECADYRTCRLKQPPGSSEPCQMARIVLYREDQEQDQVLDLLCDDNVITSSFRAVICQLL